VASRSLNLVLWKKARFRGEWRKRRFNTRGTISFRYFSFCR